MTVLDVIKSLEGGSALILVMKDEQAKKVLAAWTRYRPKCSDGPLENGETIENAFARLWAQLPEIDYEKLSDWSGVPMSTTIQIFHRLRDTEIIYPDGTVTKDAYDLLEGEKSAYLKNLTRHFEVKESEQPVSPKSKFQKKMKPKKWKRKKS